MLNVLDTEIKLLLLYIIIMCKFEGHLHFHSLEKECEILQNNRICTDFLLIFLENKRIFAKGVRDF